MDNITRTRVQERLDALGINAFEAARRAGLRREFVSELLTGKKASVRGKSLPALAEALGCDPGYLMGAQATPRLSAVEGGGMQLSGVIEPLAWREHDGSATPEETAPVQPDPRYPAEFQRVYLVVGDRLAEPFGVTGGSFLHVYVPPAPAYRDGDLVVVRRERAGMFAVCLRVVHGNKLTAAGLSDVPMNDEVQLIGLVLSATRFFAPQF